MLESFVEREDDCLECVNKHQIVNDREYFRVMTDKNQTNRMRGDTVLEVN